MSTGAKDERFTHDIEAERRVLGSCVLEPECFRAALDVLRSGDFFAARHQHIWAALRALEKAGSGTDTNTLRSQLLLAGKLEAIGGDEYLLALTDVIPTLHSVEDLVRHLRDLSVLRAVKSTAMQISAEASEPLENVGDFLERAGAALATVVETRSSDIEVLSIGEICETEYADLTRRQLEHDHFAGLRTGFAELDRTMVGLGLGDVTIVAGRPGMGKTAFAAALRLGVMRYSNASILSFEIEMDRRKIGQRLMAAEAGIDLRTLRRADFNGAEAISMAAVVDRSQRWPHHVVVREDLSMADVRRVARRVKRTDPQLQLIVIDYLQLLRGAPGAESREQQIAAIARELKILAKGLNVHLIALSQLNRGVEQRSNKDKRPQVADLRESGAIEQDADNILLLYRDEVYNPDTTTEPGIMEVILGKQRMGPIGTIKLRWTKSTTQFADLSAPDPQQAFDLGSGAHRAS